MRGLEKSRVCYSTSQMASLGAQMSGSEPLLVDWYLNMNFYLLKNKSTLSTSTKGFKRHEKFKKFSNPSSPWQLYEPVLIGRSALIDLDSYIRDVSCKHDLKDRTEPNGFLRGFNRTRSRRKSSDLIKCLCWYRFSYVRKSGCFM